MTARRDPGRYSPIVARTGRVEAPTGATSFDCAQLTFVRSGAATIFGEFPRERVQAGDLVVVAPSITCGGEPERGGVSYSTLFLDADYLTDAATWQFSAHLRDRYDAHLYLSRRYPDPMRVVPLGVETVLRLEPWLDELTDLSNRGVVQDRFLRAVALLFSVLDVIEPAVSGGHHDLPSARRSTELDPRLPRHRPFEPLRAEAASAADLLRSSLERRWTLAELAEEVGLSPNRLRHVFTQNFGKTPWAYQNMLRAQRMATLLHDRELPIPDAMRQVGWTTPGHAAKMFRRYVGMSPRQFRHRHTEH